MRSQRLEQLPPYLFVEIDRLKGEYARRGGTVLDLGIGDPDLGAPPELVRALEAAIRRPSHDRYPPGRGLPLLVDEIRAWGRRAHGVALGADEVLVTIGSKEAIGHLPLAIVNPGETVLVPDPGYPVYEAAAVFAGGHCVRFPIRAADGYWPDFGALERGPLERARLLVLNYPNNPTAAVADDDRFREAIAFCRERGIVIANDAAYGEIYYETPPARLFPLARKAGVPYLEFFSFSKTFSVTGWRIGFAIGSPEVIGALAALKANLDSGAYGAIQEAVAAVMRDGYDRVTDRIRARYRERRDELASLLAEAGFAVPAPRATFYFWVPTPAGEPSLAFCRRLLEDTGIVATPGIGFGSAGEGYFRLSITSGADTIREAGRRLARFARAK